jgi:DNA-binding HxlR family transcriptional regulator
MDDADSIIDTSYPSRRLLELIGDRWTPLVLFILGRGMQRYGGLQRQLHGISKKMLTQTLRSLEQGGLVKRTVYAEVPPRVDYDLSALGKRFVEPVEALCRWAQEHDADITAFEKGLARKH